MSRFFVLSSLQGVSFKSNGRRGRQSKPTKSAVYTHCDELKVRGLPRPWALRSEPVEWRVFGPNAAANENECRFRISSGNITGSAIDPPVYITPRGRGQPNVYCEVIEFGTSHTMIVWAYNVMGFTTHDLLEPRSRAALVGCKNQSVCTRRTLHTRFT